MSLSCWVIQGLGVALDNILGLLDAEKIRKHLIKDGFDFFLDIPKEEIRAYKNAQNETRLKMLMDYLCMDFSELAEFIAESDRKNLLSYDNNGQGRNFLYYPRTYPWNRQRNECKTEESAQKHICTVIMRFTRKDVTPETIKNEICEINEEGYS
jgi:hypothetical protein